MKLILMNSLILFALCGCLVHRTIYTTQKICNNGVCNNVLVPHQIVIDGVCHVYEENGKCAYDKNEEN